MRGGTVDQPKIGELQGTKG